MKEVHKGMGITDAQFDAAAADLKAVLETNGVKHDDVKAVLGAVETTRKDIVEGAGRLRRLRRPQRPSRQRAR